MSTERMIPALCQDCLRIVMIDIDRHNAGDDKVCKCGGQVCGCGSCMSLYARLYDGVTNSKRLGFEGPEVEIEWTPLGGITYKGEQ